MKKALSVLLALVMCFALAMPAFAADEQLPSVNDTEVTLPDLELPTDVSGIISGDTMGTIMDAISGVLDKVGDVDVSEIGSLIPQITAAVRDALAGVIGDDAMNKITEFINSNEFLKWLASIYTGSVTTEPTEAPTEAPTEPETEETTTEAAELPETGDSAVALAVFATVSVAAAAAFVCTKKKA